MAVTLTQFNNNLINPSSWTVGSGGAGIFVANGNAGEQNRYVGTDPWGNSAMVWQTVPSGDGNADGGWNTTGVAVDITKLHRFSVWARRTSSTANGTFYFGLQSDVGSATHLGADQGSNSNPYWHYTAVGNLSQNQWYLFVGHCYPSVFNGTTPHPESGIYTTTSGRIAANAGNVPLDVKWTAGTTTAVHRTYHFYCSDSTTRLEFFMPRIDKIDGTQPSITQLLTSSANPTGVVFSDGTGQAEAPTGGLGSASDRGNLVDLVSFASSGTWTNPGATKVHVKLIGGGGGGAGYCESGGGGCYAEGVYDVTGVSTVAVTVGGGGSYTTYYSAAGQGGTSSFGSYLSAIGGYGANQQYSHSGGHGGNSASGQGFFVQGGAGCGHINGVGHGSVGSIGGAGYFGGAQAHIRNHGNLGAVYHGIYQGAPGSGGPGNITDWASAPSARGHSAGEYGMAGLVIVYSYK